MKKLCRACLVAALALLFSAPLTGTAFAEPAYEPNDNLLTAYGPLANNTTYTAAIETSNDKDLYYFYVTTPSTAQLTFTVTNLGGGSDSHPQLAGRLVDSHGSEVADFFNYLGPADYSTDSVSLSAGKYLLVIEKSEFSYGESYTVATSGTDGAFGSYSAISDACAAATVPVAAYQAQLATAEGKLRQAEARLDRAQRSRKRRVRKKARAHYAHVKAVVAAEKASLKAAEAGQKPWCFIPA